MAITNRFFQHINGTMTYQMRGWHLGDGVTLPAWVTDEYETCNYFYQASMAEKQRIEKQKQKAASKPRGGGIPRRT